VYLVSVPTGRFVAAASLSHRKNIVAAASLSHRKNIVAAASLSHRKNIVADALLSLQKNTFVAAGTLTLRFPPEQSFLGASDEPLRYRVSGQHDVGHEGVIIGCDAFILRSLLPDPEESPQSERRPTIYIVDVLTKVIHNF